MRIVFCLDGNYIKYAKVSIASYKKYNPDAKITVVSETPILGIGADENIIIRLPRTFRNRGQGDRITNTAYLKLFLTQLPYDKILYVDADTICQKPLKDLWDIPCEYLNLTESHSVGFKQAQALGHLRYGLTGMMVMNLDNLRKEDFTDRCLRVEQNYLTPSTGWQHDETCINVAMYDRIKFIDRKFNYCHNRTYDNPIPEKDAYILHYVGKEKQEMLGGVKYKELTQIGKHIRGSRVAIVGNGKTIFDKKWGKEIDDHDFIIRFNKGFYAKPECQGTRTDMLILACNLAFYELESYHARFVVNRSKHYYNYANATINTPDRMKLKERLGKQPSTGFMAIDICLYFGAKSIDLYGFSGNSAPTFYNPKDYVTQHDYDKEQEIIKQYEKDGLLKNNA